MSSLRMDNLEQLSDDELRLRLVQCGLPNLPVTSTTRKILIKKLRHFIDTEKQKLRRETSKTSRYSSGEESDSSDTMKQTTAQRKSIAASSSSSGSARVGRSQRATVGGTIASLGTNSISMPPPAAAASVRSSLKHNPNSSISPLVPGQHNLSNSSSSFAGANGNHGNVANHHYVGTGSNSSSNRKASLSQSVASSIYISPVVMHDSEEEDYPPTLRGVSGAAGGSNRIFGNFSPSSSSHSSLFRKTATLATNITPPSANSSMYSNLNTSLGGAGGGSNNSSGLLNDSNGSSNSAADSSSPYISEYTKRLMQLRGETVSQENYNSAIGGIIGRRSSNTGGATALSMPSRYGGQGQTFSSRTQQPSAGALSGNHPGLLRSSGHQLLNSKAMASGVNPSPTLATSGSIIAGNHIRQRYSRLQPGGGGGSGGQYELNENDIVTHAQPSPDPAAIPFRVAIGNLITKLDEHYGFKQTFIPCALLCLLVVFLLSVAFMYMTISTDLASTLSSIDTRYDLCEEGGSVGITGTTCVQPADVEPALELLKLIGNELKARVENHHCRDAATVSGSMSAGEALKYAKEHSPSVLIPQLTRHLHAMEYLIDRNPQWRIDHCNANGEPIAFTEVLDRRSSKSNHFTILKPKLPFACMMYNKFQKFFVVVGGLAVVAIVGLLGNYFFKFILQVKQNRRDQVNGLISEIIHAVSQAAASASDAASTGNTSGKEQDARVVISHLRDRLLGPVNRRKLGWAWNEALQFLEHNESRILFEVGTIGGDDFRMMRWIDSAPLATSGPATSPVGRGRGSTPGGVSTPSAAGGGCAKKWQSPAFDNSNKIHDPPTPCLKIRQMFDKYEVNDPNLKTIVQDAILEKVGGRCKIYDIQLDRSSCCVYVRCASAKDAGIVHDEINGWWFDNRLVSIKFLRLERYMQRFPRALAGPAYLKPSNKNNSSMSHQLALHNSSGRFSGSAMGGKLMNDDMDTDPEDDEEGEEEEEVEVEPELVAIGARSGNNTTSIMGRRSGSVALGRRGRARDELNGGEDQENERD